MRARALTYAEHRCQVCNGSKKVQVHHRTYDRIGCELPSDLTVLCDKCHGLFHAAGKQKRARKKAKRAAKPIPKSQLKLLWWLKEGSATAQELALLTAMPKSSAAQGLNGLRTRKLIRRKNKTLPWQITARGTAALHGAQALGAGAPDKP